jgi:hypothetical protein
MKLSLQKCFFQDSGAQPWSLKVADFVGLAYQGTDICV